MLFRGLLLIGCLSASIAGCANAGRSGDFANAALLQSTQMAFDAAVHLSEMYSPASTRLVFSTEPRDAFGSAFAIKLREEGFAVDETGAHYGNGLNVTYLVTPLGSKRYALAVTIGNQTISRLYIDGSKGVSAAGVWARGE